LIYEKTIFSFFLLGIGRFSKFLPMNDLIKEMKEMSSSLSGGMILLGIVASGRALVLKTGFSVKIFYSREQFNFY